MARTAQTMSAGGRIAEHLSMGVLGAAYPHEAVAAALAATDKHSERVRDLPAEVVTYYVMALGLLMTVSTKEVLRVLVEGMRWLGGEGTLKVASKAAIAQARARLGPEPLRELWQQSARPLATADTPAAFYRGRRLVALDGSTLDVPDTVANRAHFGKPGASRVRAAHGGFLHGLLQREKRGVHRWSLALGHPCKNPPCGRPSRSCDWSD